MEENLYCISFEHSIKKKGLLIKYAVPYIYKENELVK